MKAFIYGVIIALFAFLVFVVVSKVNAIECVQTCTTHEEEQCHEETQSTWKDVPWCSLSLPTCRVAGNWWNMHFEELVSETQEVCEPVNVEECTCVEPTPAPISCEATGCWSPKPWTQPGYAPNTCGGIYPTVPLLQGKGRVDATSVTLAWWPVANADKYSLVYGYEGEDMVHGIVSIDRNVTGLTVGALRPDTKTKFQLWSWLGECVSRSAIVAY